jgi:FkbM family methyltransferase
VRRIAWDEPRRSTLFVALDRLRSIGFRPATVIDVGVASGTDPLREVFPEARHILIEPLREFIPDLERITSRLDRAEYIIAAAGAENGSTTVTLGRDLRNTSRLPIRDERHASPEHRAVETIRLDDVWRSRDLAGPTLLKIDVEGDELNVLRGAEVVLASCEYLVVEVEVREIFVGAPGPEVAVREMAERGFVLEDILEPAYGPTGALHVVDMAFVPRHGWLRANGRF